MKRGGVMPAGIISAKGALILIAAAVSLSIHVHVAATGAAKIEIIGKHQRGDGPAREFTVRDGDALNPGDRFQILITTEAAVFYSILYVSRDGRIAQIYPPQGEPGAIPPRTTRVVPDENNYFSLDDNRGRELMFIVTDEKPPADMPATLKKIESAATADEILAALRRDFSAAWKLEITNTGVIAAGFADPIAGGLADDIERAYTLNPWPRGLPDAPNEGEPPAEDDSIPDEVRRKAEEVRKLLREPSPCD